MQFIEGKTHDHLEFTCSERAFIYMPLEHNEDIEDQVRRFKFRSEYSKTFILKLNTKMREPDFVLWSVIYLTASKIPKCSSSTFAPRAEKELGPQDVN